MINRNTPMNNILSFFKLYLDLLIGAIVITLSLLLCFGIKSFLKDGTPLNILLNFLIVPISITMVYGFHKRYSHLNILTHSYAFRTFIRMMYIGIFFGIGMLLTGLLLTYISGYLDNIRILFPFNRGTLNAFLTQILVGTFEETIFRGFLFIGLLTRSRNLFVSAIISSILFSLIHFQTYPLPEQWYVHIGLTSIGLIFCYLYFIYRRLWVAIAAHFANNFLLAILDIKETPLDKIVVSDLSQSIVCGVVCIGLSVFLYRNRKTYSVTGFLSPEGSSGEREPVVAES